MSLEYAGEVASAAINGEVKLSIEKDGLTMTALFEVYHIPYALIAAFEMRDYTIRILTESGGFTIMRLGNACEAFHDELYAAYNAKVRKALFVQGKPLFETRGEYRYFEGNKGVQGTAQIEVHENCVLLLPPDDGGRRIPFCFLSSMNQTGFELTLKLHTGESYSFIRLGYDTTPFSDCIGRCMLTLRENAVKAVKEIDGNLSPAQISAIARLMPEGVGIPLCNLHEIAPSFVRALEAKIAQSRVANEYQILKGICDPMRICAGLKSGLAGEDNENILWLIAPGRKPGTAAVELATSEETAAATFLYQGFEEGGVFWKRLNQAMEAINFKREVIRLNDDELRKPEYADYAMAINRNNALKFIRSHFGGCVIHSSTEHWRLELSEYLNGK